MITVTVIENDNIYLIIFTVPIYVDEFWVNLHYGGEFSEWSYMNGKVEHKYFEVDKIPLVRLDIWASTIGIEGEVQFYWREPNKDFNSGRKLLENDASVHEMALIGVEVGEIDVYVKHLSEEEVEDACNPVKTGGVVIEEIEEDNDNEANVRKSGVNAGRSDRVSEGRVVGDVFLGDELLYIEGPTVEEVNENENYGDVEDIGGANASVEDDAVVDNDDAIGEANIEQSEQERKNNFFDPEYDIVNGDEDLISVLVETGQLKVGSTARAGQNEAQGGDQVGEEHTEADRETEAQEQPADHVEQPEVDAGEAQVEQTVQ